MDGIEPELVDRAKAPLTSTRGVLAVLETAAAMGGAPPAGRGRSEGRRYRPVRRREGEHRLAQARPNLDDMTIRTVATTDTALKPLPRAQARRNTILSHVEVLHIEECPSWQESGERTRRALDAIGLPDVEINFHLITTVEEAAPLSFAGSPTIMLDGSRRIPHRGSRTGPGMPAWSNEQRSSRPVFDVDLVVVHPQCSWMMRSSRC